MPHSNLNKARWSIESLFQKQMTMETVSTYYKVNGSRIRRATLNPTVLHTESELDTCPQSFLEPYFRSRFHILPSLFLTKYYKNDYISYHRVFLLFLNVTMLKGYADVGT